MNNLLKVVMVATLSLALSSCGLFKRSAKVDTTATIKQSDSTHVSVRKSDSSATNRTVTRESIDTTVGIRGSSQEGSKDLEALTRGDSLVLDDEDQRTVIDFDSETQRLRARSTVKDRNVPVRMDREVIQEASTDVRKEAIDATRVSKAEASAEQHKETSTKVKAGPDWSFWVGLYLVIGLAVFLLVMFYRRKFGGWFK